jgi:very-short-patch-repair endonuclease
MNMKEIIRRNYKPKLKKFSRNNRNNPTKAEEIMRKKILKNDQTWYRFNRQKPLDWFILDFYCSKLKLYIEIDWEYHLDQEQKKYDGIREDVLSSYNIKVIRYTNEDILDSLFYVKNNLAQILKQRSQEILVLDREFV